MILHHEQPTGVRGCIMDRLHVIPYLRRYLMDQENIVGHFLLCLQSMLSVLFSALTESGHRNGIWSVIISHPKQKRVSECIYFYSALSQRTPDALDALVLHGTSTF